MSLMRSMLLAASQNEWLRDRAAHYPFVRRTVSRFMPGETLDDALGSSHIWAKISRIALRLNKLRNTISKFWTASGKEVCRRKFP